MKITTQPPPTLLPTTAAKPKKTMGSTATRQMQRTAADMRLSPAMRVFNGTTARTSGDFDVRRVQAMRQAIANGNFRVNAQAVADKLLGNAEEFLAHR